MKEALKVSENYPEIHTEVLNVDTGNYWIYTKIIKNTNLQYS